MIEAQKAGYAVASLSKALIEIHVCKECDEDDMMFLKPTDSGHIEDAIIIIGRHLAHKTIDLSRSFGLEEPR